jgi:pantoate--beta-alanine ligase
MGALHEGHRALIRRAASAGSPVVVSVFVNPTQFAPGEDFDRYPRSLERDVQLATEAGADVVFAPDLITMYPPDAHPGIPLLPAVATEPGLEDAHRPGHFAGVLQAVARLLDFARPATAVFGEKDYQQLRAVSDMVQASGDRWGHLRILSHPTVRESDGLALSSRNGYLDPRQRERATGLYQALQSAQSASDPQGAEDAMTERLEEFDLQVDYAVVRDAKTLMPPLSTARPMRALIAAKVDQVRLIDNMPVLEH